MISQKVVMPAKAGSHRFCNLMKKLDSRLRGNDGKGYSPTFYESINLGRSMLGRRSLLMAKSGSTFMVFSISSLVTRHFYLLPAYFSACNQRSRAGRTRAAG